MVFCRKRSRALRISDPAQNGHESERILHNKSFAIDICVDFVRLRFAYVAIMHSRSLDGGNTQPL